MRKLVLDPDALRVESFPVAAEPEARGTVRGAAATLDTDCQTWESPWCGYQTYEVASCGGGCTGTSTGTGTSGLPTEIHTCFYASCDGYTC